jgi:hypothetical protein
MFKEGPNADKDLMALCIRYPAQTARMSSIKSQDYEKSIDVSEDKISFNSSNMRLFMTMKTMNMEDNVLLND